MIRESTLPCGVRLLTEAMPSVRSATIGIFADVGSAAEPPERRGISHLLEHMLFKGTTRRTARRIAEEMDADVAELRDHLRAFEKVSAGDEDGGPIALLSQRERFRWLVAPRSTVIQVSSVHAGLCENPEQMLEQLIRRLVTL